MNQKRRLVYASLRSVRWITLGALGAVLYDVGTGGPFTVTRGVLAIVVFSFGTWVEFFLIGGEEQLREEMAD
ncbi:hypothetical protein ACFQH6_20665 [Halobacteriaceae archaeon GCM10025711]